MKKTAFWGGFKFVQQECPLCGEEGELRESKSGVSKYKLCKKCWKQHHYESNKRYSQKHLVKPALDEELMPFSEIGKRIGVGTGAAFNIYDRAIKKLRKMLEADKEMYRELYEALPEKENYIKNMTRPYVISQMKIVPVNSNKTMRF